MVLLAGFTSFGLRDAQMRVLSSAYDLAEHIVEIPELCANWHRSFNSHILTDLQKSKIMIEAGSEETTSNIGFFFYILMIIVQVMMLN